MATLRDRRDISLHAIWSDSNITRRWEEDRARIFSRWPSGKGAVNSGDCRAIYHLIAALKPRRVLEIGTNVASSTLYFAAALRSHCGAEAKVTTVDILDVNAADGPWSRTSLKHPPSQYMDQFGLSPLIDFVCSPALDFLAGAESYDLIFLDGSHAHDDVYREISAAVDRLTPGGIILLHDYYPQGQPLFQNASPLLGPFRAVERYKREGAGCVTLPLAELPWPTRLGANINMSSLALLLRE